MSGFELELEYAVDDGRVVEDGVGVASGESWRRVERRKGGGVVSAILGRYHGTRTDLPPALCAAATLQVSLVWAISGKRDVLNTIEIT